MNRTVETPLIDTILKIVILFLLIAWCIGIILPFVQPVIGGAIIAIALYPFFARVKGWLGNRNMLSRGPVDPIAPGHTSAANRLADQFAG